MTSQSSASWPPEENGIYYLGKVGQRTQMTRSDLPHPASTTLPPPSELAQQCPRLPPPSHLDPPFAPQSPQGRPYYSDLPTRHPIPLSLHSAYSQSHQQNAEPRWQRPPYVEGASQRDAVRQHPPLFEQKNSYQSRLPGTVYEALSPVQYGRHEQPIESSLSDETAYNRNPYHTTSQPSHHSPSGSYHSSTTSSSGFSQGPTNILQPINVIRPQPREGKQSSQKMADRYLLHVRQQPIAARACGFGERDRRVIDPPPIVQFTLTDFDFGSSHDLAELKWPFHVVHCRLLSVGSSSSSIDDPASDVTAVQDPNQANRIHRRLVGTNVSSPFVSSDPDIPNSIDKSARLACFFVFPDLSCRQYGIFKLRFSLMKIPLQVPEGGEGDIIACVDSDVFEVYSAKDFPGMRASTFLTKELKKQGATVSVKKGNANHGGTSKKNSSNSDRNGSEGSEDSPPKPKSSKARKKKA